MTNVQLYLATGVPIIAILISMALSLVQISGIRGSIAEIHVELRALRTEFREELRILRTDLNTLTGKVIEIDNRLTRIEERLGYGR